VERKKKHFANYRTKIVNEQNKTYYSLCRLKLIGLFEFYIIIKEMISSVNFNGKCVSFIKTPLLIIVTEVVR